jgi:hypothetical protein
VIANPFTGVAEMIDKASYVNKRIYAFGNPDRSKDGFPDREDLIEYIKWGVFASETGRYRQTANQPAEIVILSRDGFGFGHFEIFDRVVPSAQDKIDYPRVRRVYLVSRSVCYEKPVRLYDHGIRVGQAGTGVTPEQFAQVLQAAGTLSTHESATSLPNPQLSEAELDRVLASVRARLNQSEFRQTMLERFESKCVVTGCSAKEALEAAHIDPWCNSQSNHIRNGLLLRADIHSLFDQGLITLHPSDLLVFVSPKLAGTEYELLNRKPSRMSDAARSSIDREALEFRWKLFERALGAGDNSVTDEA